jgi:hypothetical protein
LKVLLTHTPQSRAQYYGARALSGLQAIAQVKLHESDDALDAAGDREPVAGNGTAGREDHRRRSACWRRQRRALDAPFMNNDLPCFYGRWTCSYSN